MRPPWEELEPASRGAVERKRHAAYRVEQFGTTVFAVALALPVIQLVTQASSLMLPASSLAQALRAILPAFGACVAALLALIACWFLYHIAFHYLTRSSGTLLLLHGILLPAALLIPFSAALLDTLALYRQAVLLFGGNIILLQLLLALIWRHAVKAGLLFGSDVPRRVVLRIRLMLGASVAALAIATTFALLSPVVSVTLLAAILAAQMALIARGGYRLDLYSTAARSTGEM